MVGAGQLVRRGADQGAGVGRGAGGGRSEAEAVWQRDVPGLHPVRRFHRDLGRARPLAAAASWPATRLAAETERRTRGADAARSKRELLGACQGFPEASRVDRRRPAARLAPFACTRPEPIQERAQKRGRGATAGSGVAVLPPPVSFSVPVSDALGGQGAREVGMRVHRHVVPWVDRYVHASERAAKTVHADRAFSGPVAGLVPQISGSSF